MDQVGLLPSLVGLLLLIVGLIVGSGVGAILGLRAIDNSGLKAAARTAAIACLILAALAVFANIVDFGAFISRFQGPLQVLGGVLIMALFVYGFVTIGFAGVVALQSGVVGLRWIIRSAFEAAFHRRT